MAINRIPYRTSLRVLGRLLDGDRARMVTVCEIEQGFLLYYFQRGEPGRVTNRALHGAEVLDLDELLQRQRGSAEFSPSSRGLRGLLRVHQSEARRFQKSHPLLPMGYEHALRALGHALDRRSAQAVALSELDDRLHVEYTVDRADFVIRHGQRQALPGRRAERFRAPQIADLVHKHHAAAVEQVRRSGQHLSHNPMDAMSYLDAAAVLTDHGQYDEAEGLYHRALAIAPRQPEVHYHLARLARRRGDHKAAMKHVQLAIQDNAEDGRFFHLLGRTLIDRHRFKEAAQALQQAVVCDPDNKIYHFHLGQVYERLGRTGEAQAALASGAGPVGYRARKTVEELWGEPASGGAGRARVPVAADRPAASVEEEMAREAWETRQTRQSAATTATAVDFPPAGSTTLPVFPATDSLDFPTQGSPDFPTQDASLAFASFGVVADGAGTVADDSPASTPSSSSPPPPAESPFALTSRWDEPLVPTLPLHDDARPLAGPHDDERAPVADAGHDLPVLGIAAAHDWTAPSLPLVEVPADGAAAAAALPLAGVGSGESGEADYPGLAATADPILPSGADEAVQLAAAILRAEELVRNEPDRADLHRKLGFLLARQGRSEEAAAEFRRAVACGRRRPVSSQ